MKKLLFSFIFVLLACQLLAQHKPNVLLQTGHRMPHHSLMPRHAYPEQNQKTALSGEMDFRLPDMQNTEIAIRVDSVFYLDEYGNFKEILTHDTTGNMLTYLRQYWENGTWVNSSLYSYTYDANGNMLTGLFQDWENGVWVNSSLYTHTYDANGNKLSYLWHNWENGEWVNFYLFISTYDGNGNMLTELYQGRENGDWVNSKLYTYTYDANGNWLTRLSQDWKNDDWVNKQLHTCTYNDNGNMLTALVRYWRIGEWVNDWLSTYTYDTNGNWLTCLSQDWGIGEWVNYLLYTYTNDANGNMLITLCQDWENGEWVNDQKREYIFLSGQVNATAYDWDGSNWIESSYNDFLEIIMGGEYLFYYYAINLELYYTDVTGIEEQDVCLYNSPIRCYPNPVIDQINIEIDPAWQAKHYLLELFGQTGQKVKSFEISSDFGSSALPLNVEDVPPGLYLLRVTAGKQTLSQKIIISK